MGVYGYFIIIGIAIVFFAAQSVAAKRAKAEKMKKFLDETYGKRPGREYKYEEYSRIRFYFDRRKEKYSESIVDDITWNDLSMDNIFMLLNNTNSSIGEEYLYSLIRTINFDTASLEEFNSLSEYFLNNPDKAKKLQYIYSRLGRTKSISFFDFIHRLGDLDKKSNLLNYICAALAFGTIGMFFINPAIAVMVLIAVFSFNIYTYYKEKGRVGNYFVCCKYLVGMVECAKEIENFDAGPLKEYNGRINRLTGELKYLTRNMYLISDGTMNDSIMGIIMEYVKMLFHVDLIKFNSIVKATDDKIDMIDELYETMGRIEAAIAVSSFKRLLINEYGVYGTPCIEREGHRKYIAFTELFHPIIENAVKNSMAAEKAVLLTGSNASGKSTFLKTVAINAILAQTIYTVCAESLSMSEALIYSSMALRDDLESNESYYIVEIKSLKRILDKSIKGKKQIMCFIDEVLRGTNTVERIAASSVILDRLSREKTVCFAATHDIELTKILEQSYKNYHFEEEVVDDDVLFNYQLKMGPTTTRNAIKLLKVIGYDMKIIDEAGARAEYFTKQGIWK